MVPPPPPPEPVLGLHIISHVNAGIEFIDDLDNDNERDELVEQINLHGNSIQSMDGLENFTGLVELCLSSNCLEEIAFHALQPLVHLRVLDLSANRLLSTRGFPHLPRLEELSIAHNRLQGLDEFTRPIKFPKLQYLDLRGNAIAECNNVSVLQRLKRLTHLRLQAVNGDQANPVCDLDHYPQNILQLLPRLKLLDEEDVGVLYEMGSLHMPKYRSFVRRIVERKRPDRSLNQSRRDTCQETAFLKGIDCDNVSRERKLGNCVRVDATSCSVNTGGSRFNSETNEKETSPALGLVLKDASTNTSVDLEKDLLKCERVSAQRETECQEKEQAFLANENALLVREKSLKAQLADLKGKLEAAEARATKAEATVVDMSNHLVQKEKEQAATTAASDAVTKSAQKSQSEQQFQYEASLESLKATHQIEIDRLTVRNTELKAQMAVIKTDFEALKQRFLEVDEQLRHEMMKGEKRRSKATDIAGELELARKTHDAIATQLSDEVKYHKDRVEQSDKRSGQLEKQVTELKANIEAVYNKCIEKDDTIQQLKKSLLAGQDDIDALRSQHERDCERHEKFQQQQQDLYDRQLQASMIQVEMEFRKEYQQFAQKYQFLQRKSQERLKDNKRVQEAYQQSLQREAAAKAEIDKMQAILADDKKKLFLEDIKRSDAFKAAIREERAKCKELEQRLIEEQRNYAQVAVLRAEQDEKRLENDRLCGEIFSLEEKLTEGKKVEDDLRAALKVKDVIIADHLRQIKELTQARQRIDAQFYEEMAEYQAQIDDLEAALDESLQKAADEEVKRETLDVKLTAMENDTVKKEEQLKSVRAELDQKVAALEFLDQEMQRMRTVLDAQDERFQKRMQKHLELHREEVEGIRASAEEERAHQLLGWEAKQKDMMHHYEALATEMAHVAAANAKLRVALDQERRKTAQNDRDMRTLLAQIDRERQSKKENLRQIKSLFEQLQREAS